MKILCTSDWHLGCNSHGIIDKDGRNSRLSDIENLLHRIIDFATKEQVDLFLMAGDIFHTNRPSADEQRVFWGVLCHLEDNGIQSRFIIGNHDYTSQIGKSHALALFDDITRRQLRLTKIYDKTTSELIGDCVFHFMPYKGDHPEYHKFGTFENNDQIGKNHILVCHSHLEGAIVGAEPFEIQNDHATSFKSIPVDYVIAGHFHKPQILSSVKPISFYPGSIHPIDFNERLDVKGVVLLNTETGNLTPVGFKTRKFVQIDLECSNDIADVDVKDAIIKVNVKYPEGRVHEYDELKIRKQLESSGSHCIASINLEIVKQEVRRDPEIKFNNETKSNFIRYLEQKDYGLLKEDIMKFGLEIIEKCRQ